MAVARADINRSLSAAGALATPLLPGLSIALRDVFAP